MKDLFNLHVFEVTLLYTIVAPLYILSISLSCHFQCFYVTVMSQTAETLMRDFCRVDMQVVEIVTTY